MTLKILYFIAPIILKKARCSIFWRGFNFTSVLVMALTEQYLRLCSSVSLFWSFAAFLILYCAVEIGGEFNFFFQIFFKIFKRFFCNFRNIDLNTRVIFFGTKFEFWIFFILTKCFKSVVNFTRVVFVFFFHTNFFESENFYREMCIIFFW
jgi:hypothetical protein